MSNMAMGVEVWAAEIVVSLKQWNICQGCLLEA